MGTFKTVCTKCGKEIEMDDKFKNWVENKGGKPVCKNCYAEQAKAKKSDDVKAEPKKQTKVPASAVNIAAVIRQSYDELTAEFSDIRDEVKDYIGGWTSTIVINKLRQMGL